MKLKHKTKYKTKHCKVEKNHQTPYILKCALVISGLLIGPKPLPEPRLKILQYMLMSQCRQYPYVINMPVVSDHWNDIKKVRFGIDMEH